MPSIRVVPDKHVNHTGPHQGASVLATLAPVGLPKTTCCTGVYLLLQHKSEVKLPAVREDPRGDRAEYLVWVSTTMSEYVFTCLTLTQQRGL